MNQAKSDKFKLPRSAPAVIPINASRCAADDMSLDVDVSGQSIG